MKRLTVILCLLLSALLLTGCASENMPLDSETQMSETNYEAKIIGFSDSVSTAKLSKEYSLEDTTSYAERTVGEPIELNLNEKKLRGNFKIMSYSSYEFFPRYTYSDENNKSFSVNHKDQLISYYWFHDSSNKETISEEACIEKAKAFVAQEITDPSPYTISVETRNSKYVVTFQKYVGTVKTTEFIEIQLNYSGEFYLFSSSMLEQIPSNAICDFDMTKVNETITKRLDEMFANAKENYDEVTYTFDEPLFTVLKDGRYAMYCSVDVDCINGPFEDTDENGNAIQVYSQDGQCITFIVTK